MIGAVVLAAGASTRMGRPKAVATWRGETFVRRAVKAAGEGGCEPIVVVVGADAEQVRPALRKVRAEVVPNPDWRQGMGSSIARGVAALMPRTDLRAVLVLTCDQPRIEASVVTRLREAFDGRPRRRVASAYAGVLGVPALFERSLFPELAGLRGDRGARSVLLAEPELVVAIPWPEGALDVDREEDL